MVGSAGCKPALGRAGERVADTVVFVRWLSKGKGDVEGKEGRGCWGVECVRDRYGDREGRWRGWDVGGDGRLRGL